MVVRGKSSSSSVFHRSCDCDYGCTLGRDSSERGAWLRGWFDGGVRGGRGSCGAAITNISGKLLWFGYGRAGGCWKNAFGRKATNNEAEYSGLKLLLGGVILLSSRICIEGISLFGDSMLVVKQMTGEWSVRKGGKLEQLHDIVFTLMYEKLPVPFSIEWVPREKNAVADWLAGIPHAEHEGKRKAEERKRRLERKNGGKVEGRRKDGSAA